MFPETNLSDWTRLLSLHEKHGPDRFGRRDLVLLMDMPHVMWDGRLLASLCVPTVRRNERIAFVVHVEETDTLHSQSNDDPMVCHNPLS